MTDAPSDPPRPVGTENKIIDIYHCFIPKNQDGTVVLVSMAGALDARCVPVFTTLDKLHQAMRQFQMPFDRIGQITDPAAFLCDIPHDVKVVVDLRRHENGKIRYHELKRD